MSHVMLDLETMGNGATAPIIAIGAVVFDANGTDETFYTQVSLESSMALGLKPNASTILWWLQQSDEARSAFKGNDKAPDLGEALGQFAAWFAPVGGQQLWGNGASFDNAILAHSYRVAGIPQPWKFWNDRCYRTMKSIYSAVPVERKGTHHNALDDAISQAEHLIQICNVYGVPLE